MWSNRDKRTLLDKMLALLGIVAIAEPFYLVADAYYAARKIVTGLLEENNHLVTRVKSNAVAYTAHQQRGPRKRGRPRVYGSKVKLKSLLEDPKGFQQAESPVYGEHQVIIQYRVRDLLWRPAGQLVRFVAVIHPARGSCLLMCTDTSLEAIEIIRLYGLRFKIEHTFKQAVRLIGSFTYHFWMSAMKPLRRRSGNQHLHRQSLEYRNAVKRKLHAYHVFIQAGVVCQDYFSSGRRLRLEFLRLLAAHHSARHPALGAGRGQCPAPEPAGISLECRPEPQTSPHFPYDIKESGTVEAIPKRIVKPPQMMDPCEVAKVVPRSPQTGESASRCQFGSYHGHPGARFVPREFATCLAACWSRTFTPSVSILYATPRLACCTAAPWRSVPSAKASPRRVV